MNVIAVTGNICKDIKIDFTKNGKEVLTNTIAVQKGLKNEKTGKYESDFIEFVCFEKKANFLKQYATKGTKIEITGKLRVDSWKDDNGDNHSRTYIVADNINILSKKEKEKSASEVLLEIKDEDLPF